MLCHANAASFVKPVRSMFDAVTVSLDLGTVSADVADKSSDCNANCEVVVALLPSL